MATVEQASATRPNFAVTENPNRPAAVGRIGPWQLASLLSESELARVYAARSADAPAQLAPSYVVKVLRKEWWRDPQAIEMQRRAAWVGRRAVHPNLLPVLSANVQHAPFYFVTPKLEGHTLSEIQAAGRRLPLAVVLWIGRQIAEGLAALHELTGMIHADVKPSNILVSPDGHATLLDFGFAHAPAESRHWSTRPVVGTLNYVAPEVVTSSLAGDVSADLYSLGVTLYEQIAGELPFAAKAPEELVRMHRETTPLCLRRRQPTVPKGVASLIHRLLAKDPLRRPDSASEVVEELVRLEIECFSER